MTLGIGLVTYNRRDVLLGTLGAVLRHLRTPFHLVVADDGSTDGTPEMVRAKGVPVITGANSGVAWNKNRALYVLGAMKMCDTVILLEDDARPVVDGWEREWIEAAGRLGHVNLARPGFQDFLSGRGTVADPLIGLHVSAQCSAFSAVALAAVGYFDTRFHGFGHEHVEHTYRMARAGYGGRIDYQGGVRHPLIYGGIEVEAVPSFADEASIARNLDLCREIMTEPVYRPAWRDEAEFHRLRGEIESARL